MATKGNVQTGCIKYRTKLLQTLSVQIFGRTFQMFSLCSFGGVLKENFVLGFNFFFFSSSSQVGLKDEKKYSL